MFCLAGMEDAQSRLLLGLSMLPGRQTSFSDPGMVILYPRAVILHPSHMASRVSRSEAHRLAHAWRSDVRQTAQLGTVGAARDTWPDMLYGRFSVERAQQQSVAAAPAAPRQFLPVAP